MRPSGARQPTLIRGASRCFSFEMPWRAGFLCRAHWRRDDMDKIPMTIQGHKALGIEFEHRTATERRRIIDAIAEARAHGDLSENAEYHAAKEQQSLNEGRIKELETILALADVIDVTKLSGTSVKFGATVTYIDEDTEEEKTYQIVGDPEAD